MLWLRQMGLAFASLVAASLILSLVAWIVPFGLIQPGPLAGIAMFVLGWLIYRDIVRRDPRHFGGSRR